MAHFAAAAAAAANQAIYSDKDSVVHYNGDPFFGEEYEERCLLGYESQPTKETKASYPQEWLVWESVDAYAQEGGDRHQQTDG